jgi:hypothetical protein
MSTVTTSRPLNLLSIDFPDLYARHLCRHSQFGINVFHLAALFGLWFGVYGLVYLVAETVWVPIALAAAYLAVLATNCPARVVAACGVFLAGFLAVLFVAPEMPFWVYLLMIPVFYKLQSWSHKVWNVSTDMTEFNAKYPKGRVLFIVLLIYEVPICMHYLVFDRKR